MRWDSWRLWESLLFGCCAINLDMDLYGFELPVMPINREHYVGIRLDSIGDDIEWILNNEKQLREIGKNGQEWVLKEYTPEAVAIRFLENAINNPQYQKKQNSTV